MEPASRVPFIGLTGGMGAGKSEALGALGELGAATLSTDAVVHELLGSEDVRDALVERFGPDIAPGGAVDRSKVGERVFGDPDEREWLEEQLWPRVGRRVAEWRQESEAAGPKAAVVEVPLLFEAGMEDAFDHTLAVVAEEATRERRAAERGHAGAASRHERQLSQEEKAHRADFVVRNDGTRDELKHSLTQVLAKIGT
ncbi:MAG TPA: dephospho-CoA kinase [Thermoleophilaceae bacterium]|nr:dephospho-CoA kinase [Thermoleophilaceae bacterium]